MVEAAGDDGEELGEFDAEEARRVLEEASGRVGLDPAGAVLMRLGDHAVFRLADVPVVARIGRRGRVRRSCGSQNVGADDRTAAEFGKRMRALRTGASRRDWEPF